MAERFILGIDPGRKGALVLLDGHAVVYQQRADGPDGYHKHPTNSDPSEVAMLAALRAAVQVGSPALVILEAPAWHAAARGIGRMSPGVAGRSGIEHGIWRALLLANGYAYRVLSPKEWRKAACIAVPSKGDPKAATIDHVGRLLPTLDLTPGAVRSPHDGLADAAGLALAGVPR